MYNSSMLQTQKVLKISNLPFAWRLFDPKKDLPSETPLKLPFEFSFDEKNNLLIQRPSLQLKRSLSLIYDSQFNMGNIVAGHSLGLNYANDFLSFFRKNIEINKYKSILEIGSGDGIVLEQLEKDKFEVCGIDPYAGADTSLNIIKDFFPSKKITKKFDVIFHIDVIEHVENPVDFLKKQIEYLNTDGLIIIATPNCSVNIENGDISIAYHEHYSYFDPISLSRVVQNSGLEVVNLETSNFGNSLYLMAKKTEKKRKRKIATNRKLFDKYVNRSSSLLKKIKSVFDKNLSQRKSIGIYVPIRALSYLAKFDLLEKVRMFDDNPLNYGKCFEGVETKIENFEDLVKTPTDIMFIMSIPFGSIIKVKINKKLPQVKVYTLSDFFTYGK